MITVPVSISIAGAGGERTPSRYGPPSTPLPHYRQPRGPQLGARPAGVVTDAPSSAVGVDEGLVESGEDLFDGLRACHF